jgi:ABC-type multidrug transport system permease subunit
MTPSKKTLESGSRYERHDLDGDGIVSDEEIAREKEMVEMELREEKSEAQKRMAWIAMISMIAFSIFLFLPIVSDSRVKALADLLGLFYIAQAGVVGAYMGATAWMSKK